MGHDCHRRNAAVAYNIKRGAAGFSRMRTSVTATMAPSAKVPITIRLMSLFRAA